LIKFKVDAQLPYSLTVILKRKGFDVVHTDNLPNKEKTTDNEIRLLAEAEKRIVITKDNDFFDSYILKKSPPRLFLISTGNIINKDLFILFENILS
jgi:predicted nuclease of predicted toxin-antitoxin system